jgi:hypothetical protein
MYTSRMSLEGIYMNRGGNVRAHEQLIRPTFQVTDQLVAVVETEVITCNHRKVGNCGIPWWQVISTRKVLHV